MEKKHEQGKTAVGVHAALRADEKTARRMVRGQGIPAADLDDVTQEVLLAVAGHRTSFQAPQGRASADAWRAFIWGVAMRQVKSWRRAHSRRLAAEQGASSELPQAAPSTEDVMIASEPVALFHRALAALERETPHLHEVAQLHLDGLPSPSIARAVGIPYGTAWTRLRQTREVLRETVSRLSRRRA